MSIIYSDQEIEALVQEHKPLPKDWRNRLLSPNNKKRELLVIGDMGNKFRIIIRQNDFRPSDFSVILAVLVLSPNRNFRLRRYNGWTSRHRNRLEREIINGFHIHFATERYQRKGLKEDAYAQRTERYRDCEEALRCLIVDANFQEPPQ